MMKRKEGRKEELAVAKGDEREPARRRRRRRRRRRVLLNVQFGPRGNRSLTVVHQSSFNRSLHHIQSQRAKKPQKTKQKHYFSLLALRRARSSSFSSHLLLKNG